MFVTLDREAMRVIHAHPDYRVASGLATIELSPVACAVLDAGDPACWGRYTDLELKLVYRNTCGQELLGYMRADHITRVCAVVQALPALDVNAYEVRMQSLAIGEGAGRYRYARGTTIPQLMTELFAPVPLTGSAPVLAASTAPAAPTGPDRAATATTPSAATPKAPRPAGSVTSTIHEVADQLWEKKGKPHDARTVLELRKHIMDVLEADHGIKRSTSSSTLGAWQKARLNR